MVQHRFPTRREFLRGRATGPGAPGRTSLFSLAAAIADPLSTAGQALSPAAAAGPPPLADPTGEPYLVQVSRRAMACQFQVFLNAGQYAGGCESAIAALDLVDQLEAQLTVFRGSSEVSRINRDAAFGPVTVERRLFDLLVQSVELWKSTDGAFDITAGPLSTAWGFARRDGRLPGREELAAALSSVGSQHLRLKDLEQGVEAATHEKSPPENVAHSQEAGPPGADAPSIEFLRDGVQLNLGAIGKGYALDRAAALLTTAGVNDFLFHGGQSSLLARGNRAATGEGWTVGLIHPLRPEQRIGEIRLRDRALSTSGSGTQFFTHRGRRFGHILDPRTGWPAEGTLSATVLAPTAAEADALSTALFVLGPSQAVAWCQQQPDISAILMWPGTKASTLEVATVNLDERDWRRLRS